MLAINPSLEIANISHVFEATLPLDRLAPRSGHVHGELLHGIVLLGVRGVGHWRERRLGARRVLRDLRPDCKLSSETAPWLLEMSDSLVTLTGHRRKVGLIAWHPTADNVLASAAHDNMVMVWNVKKGEVITSISCHPDTVHSLSWDRTGARLVTTCKDKRRRLIDARTGSVSASGQGHGGGKASKVVWLEDKNLIFTTGFSKHSERQFAIWDPSNLSKPLKLETLDCSSGVLNPVYDPDTSMMYLIGRGDGNVRFYEILPEAPWVFYLSEFVSGTPHRSLAVLPKRGVDVMSCEITRFFKLHTNRDMVEPISMVVPRKTDMFQDDLYPETAAPIPALTGDKVLNSLYLLHSLHKQLFQLMSGSLARTQIQ